MFIVIPLHRESLRQMMDQGLVTHSIKIEVLEMLKRQITDSFYSHGDIKEFWFLRVIKFNADYKNQEKAR